MEHESLEEIYSQVFKHVYPQVRNLERGILHRSIQVILGEEKIYANEKTLKICNWLSIENDSSIEDDYKIVNELIDSVFINRIEKIHKHNPSSQLLLNLPPIKQIIQQAKKVFRDIFLRQDDLNKEEKMKWIVIAACALVGLYFCIQYLNRNKQQSEGEFRGSEPHLALTPFKPADLCLVVLASIASNFQEHSELSIDELKYLIGSSSYFLCTTVEEAESIEKTLDTTSEYISPDSSREVFIRINLINGSYLIGERIPYSLKEKLQANTKSIVKKIGCLDSLSGLESFNLV